MNRRPGHTVKHTPRTLGFSLATLLAAALAAHSLPAQTASQASTSQSATALGPAPAQTAAAPAAPAPLTPLVQPATTELAQLLPTIHPDKWKLSSDLRRRNDENLSSISGDLSGTLPNLLSAADAAPGQLPPMLAVSRNLHALYDVVLRLVATAEIAAPEGQAASLTHALASLSSARQTLDGQLDTSAADQQKQISTLQTSLSSANASLASTRAALQQAQTAAAKPSPATRPHSKIRRKPPATSPSTEPSTQTQ